ncbi:hypothetical protein [Streptomyces griseoviridis]|uniref:Glycosyltransferase family 1 protein n=1 Tax=Streptomyces griseoviridis TaxID=45398 RepID=A0ABT9L965_STRGD|nr:hypothetical protein [Streptomyces griseoviridis]MDP9680252.1 hypothetical protein [Streptomyces griseoviridis]GGT24744.1 hypothetical protein GCM10010240_66530 [Streptomyces griseoviridis]
MRIVMGAQNCGFGPVAELVAVSRPLHAHERVFVGDGVAAVFARRNPDAFDTVHDIGGLSGDARSAVMDDLLRGSDHVVSVMDAELVVRSVVARRPVTMVDSLFSFWQLTRPPARIREVCATMPRSRYSAADRHLAGLSPHERVVAAHLLATHSVVQNFPGVTERAAGLAALGGGPEIHLTGSIIDVEGARNAAGATGPEYDLLINIGGFKNFLLDFDVNNAYVRLLHQWLPDLLRDWPQFRRVLVCGGPFGEGRERTVRSAGGGRADCRLLRQRDLLQVAAGTADYLMAPGLTALHEAVALGRLPLALHEQHYAHVFTMRALDGTLFGHAGCRFTDVVPDHPLPEDDLAGTAALAELAGRVQEDSGLYATYRRRFNERIEQYLSLTPAQRRHGAGELGKLLDGAPVQAVMTEVLGAAHPA